MGLELRQGVATGIFKVVRMLMAVEILPRVRRGQLAGQWRSGCHALSTAYALGEGVIGPLTEEQPRGCTLMLAQVRADRPRSDRNAASYGMS